jgi:SAM-dependent methyltransferase
MLYRHRDDSEAEAFIHELHRANILKKGQRVLDLACGNGRHVRMIHALGLNTTGLDISEPSIAEAKRLGSSGQHFVTGDMRNFTFPSPFDVVLNLFTSFGYFEKLEENASVIQCVARNLDNGGTFVIDYFNSVVVEAALPSSGNSSCDHTKFEFRKYKSGDFVIKEIDVEDNGEQHHFTERVQLLRREDLISMLNNVGLEVLHTFGNYRLENFNETVSDRLILVARKS